MGRGLVKFGFWLPRSGPAGLFAKFSLGGVYLVFYFWCLVCSLLRSCRNDRNAAGVSAFELLLRTFVSACRSKLLCQTKPFGSDSEFGGTH